MKKKRSILIISLLMLSILLFGCTGKKAEAPKETGEKPAEKVEKLDSIKLEGGTDWGMSNPFLQDPRGPGTGKVKLIFDSLLDADSEGLVGWLAKDWKFEDGKYIFTIYDDAKFHDGKPVTTEDIGFSIDYYKEHSPINNSLGAEEDFIIKDYEIVDEHTISIEAKEAEANTLNQLGSFLIIPKHVWEKVEDPYTYTEDNAFIGSGPYKWGEYDGATGSYEFIENEDFYGREPVAKRILFLAVSDPILAFENGEIDITDVPADLMEKYESDDSIEMITKDNDFGHKMLINMEKLEEFKDLEMRKALYHGINREAIVDKVFRGLGDVGSAGYVPVTNLFYNDKVEKYDYDMDLAMEKFKDFKMEADLLVSNSDVDVDIAELVKNDLEKLGIKINVLALDGKVRDEKVFEGDYDFALVGNGGWGRTPDYLRTLYSDESKLKVKNPHGMGPIGYENKKITELAEAQTKELDPAKRMEMFKELQLEISKEIPILVLGNKSSKVMFRKDHHKGWTKTYDYQQLEQNRMSYVKH